MTKRAGKAAKRRAKAVSPKRKTTANPKRKTAKRTKKPKPAETVLRKDAGRGETARDAALVSRSVRERWATTYELRSALRRRVQLKAMTTEDPRALAQLARVDVNMEGQNQRDEIVHDMAAARALGMDMGAPLAGAQIQNAQIVLVCPDNGRGPKRGGTKVDS